MFYWSVKKEKKYSFWFLLRIIIVFGTWLDLCQKCPVSQHDFFLKKINNFWGFRKVYFYGHFSFLIVDKAKNGSIHYIVFKTFKKKIIEKYYKPSEFLCRQWRKNVFKVRNAKMEWIYFFSFSLRINKNALYMFILLTLQSWKKFLKISTFLATRGM